MSERRASMGDKVYRGDVVKFIRNNISLGTFMKRTVKTADEACWDLCDKLNYVPAIEEKPEPHWIPVEQELPEYGVDCIVSVKQKYTWQTDLEYFVDLGWRGDYIDGAWDTANDWDEGQETHISAWMPLPEPYKGVKE